jgi:hypothetical protein
VENFVCNLYSITPNQAAIIALFRVMNQYVGNLPPMPGVFPDYPAPVGRFAMMSDGSDTLGAWTARDRPIANRDIVAWYTVGFHHITRMEDWPVMPTHWFGFTLMPHNFFTTNPAMTIRDVK